MKTLPRLLLISTCGLWMSCNLINPAEGVPAFVAVDEYTFETTSVQGTSSEKFTEIWAFDQGTMMGAFELPASIPVLAEGSRDMSFFAGIKNNGISSTRIMYPFLKPHEVSVDLTAGDTIVVKPEFEYRDNVFFIHEDFESGSQLGETSSSQVQMSIVDNTNPDDVFEGEHSAYVEIPGDFVLWEGRWQNEMFLPATERIWLELNYKCNNTFAVGLYAVQGVDEAKSLALIMNPTTDDAGVPQWNKIYVELTTSAAQYPSADYFNLYLECARQTDVETAQVWLDNLKIVHFE